MTQKRFGNMPHSWKDTSTSFFPRAHFLALGGCKVAPFTSEDALNIIEVLLPDGWHDVLWVDVFDDHIAYSDPAALNSTFKYDAGDRDIEPSFAFAETSYADGHRPRDVFTVVNPTALLAIRIQRP